MFWGGGILVITVKNSLKNNKDYNDVIFYAPGTIINLSDVRNFSVSDNEYFKAFTSVKLLVVDDAVLKDIIVNNKTVRAIYKESIITISKTLDALRVIATRSSGFKKYTLAREMLSSIFDTLNKKETAALLNIGYANMISSIKKNK